MPVRLGERSRRLLVAGIHLAVLWAFAFVQPLFDVLRTNPAFFAIRGSAPIDIVVFAVGLMIVPPLVLVMTEGLATLVDPRLGSGLHLLFLAALVALFALQAFERVSDTAASSALIPLEVVTGVAAAAAYRSAPPLRSILTVLSPTPLLFLCAFLFFSPVTKLIFPGDSNAGVANVRARSPIVFITFDQFPLPSLLGTDGHIDAKRYPNFAELAKESYWFRNTAATSDLTELAVPAIQTGIRPAPTDLPILQDHPRNIFTLLGRSHQLHVAESVTHLCPQKLCHVRQQGFTTRMHALASDLKVVGLHMILPSDLDDRLPSITGKWQGFGDYDPKLAGSGRVLDSAQRLSDLESIYNRREFFEGFVRSIRADSGGRPPLYFIHVLLPHFPFEYLPSGKSYGNPDFLIGLDAHERWVDDPTPVERDYQRHLLQVGFVDRLLGQLLRRLRLTEMYDPSLIVVVADHGASFRPGKPVIGWDASTTRDYLPVPLFIKAPGQLEGHTVDTHLQTIDVLPTVADLLGIDMPWKVDGHSAFSPNADRREGLLHHPHDNPRKFSFRDFDSYVAEGLRRKIRLFGTGEEPGALYRVGPRPELLGRLVSDLPAVRSAALRMTLNQPELFSIVAARSRFTPAHITGELHGAGAAAAHSLAVAVNGRIVAVMRSIPRPGSNSRFSAIAPEASFRNGVNRVQILEISGGGTQPALASLGATRPVHSRFSLGHGRISFLGHRPIRIDRRSVEGLIEHTSNVGQDVRFDGWALRTKDRRPVDRILAFVGDQLAVADKPHETRADVGRYFKTAPGRLGFSFSLRGELAKQAGVHVFAVAGGVASRLPYACAPAAKQVIGC